MEAIRSTSSRPGMRLTVIALIAASMAACGGGGGGGSTGSTTNNTITLPTTPVTITSSNQNAVAGAAVDAITNGTSLPTAAQTSASAPSAVSTAQMLGKLGLSAAQSLAAQTTTQIVTGAAVTVNCLISGTMTENYAADGTGTVTYNNCVNVQGQTLSGTLIASNIVATQTSFSGKTTFDLTVVTTNPANTLVAKGDMTVSVTMTQDAITGAISITGMSISGTSLSMSNTDPARGNWGLQNYLIAMDGNFNLTAMTFTFASTVINGTATFTMTTPFVYGAGMFPTSGAATIAGAGSTKLRMTILGDETAPVGSQVKLELSTDGGANYGTPSFVTWATISSQL